MEAPALMPGIVIARHAYRRPSGVMADTGAGVMHVLDLFEATHLPAEPCQDSDCIWMVPAWVPPTEEPEA